MHCRRLFFDSNYHQRPSVIPELVMDEENADDGGAVNAFSTVRGVGFALAHFMHTLHTSHSLRILNASPTTPSHAGARARSALVRALRLLRGWLGRARTRPVRATLRM